MKILVIYGSLAEKSINKAFATALLKNAPEGIEIELQGVADLPLYDEDLEEKNFPESAVLFNKKIADADGVIIVTPEYNRSIPGPLKNAIDWSSRPEGKMPWPGKPVSVTGTSNGLRGASFAQYDIRKILSYFDARPMGQPELYVGQGDKKFSPDGEVNDEKTKELIGKFLMAFKKHVEWCKR